MGDWKTLRRCLTRSTVHHQSDKFLVVHIALRVFLIVHQLFHFLVAQLLAKGCQQMSQLGRGDEARSVLVEMAKTFNKVIGSVTRSLL